MVNAPQILKKKVNRLTERHTSLKYHHDTPMCSDDDDLSNDTSNIIWFIRNLRERRPRSSPVFVLSCVNNENDKKRRKRSENGNVRPNFNKLT